MQIKHLREYLMHQVNFQVCNYLLAICVAMFSCIASHAGENSSAQKTGDSKIRVLIVDGYSNHDWQLTTKCLRGILEPSEICSCAVSTAPSTADSPDMAT